MGRVAITVRRAQPGDFAFIESLGAATAGTSISRIREVPLNVVVGSFRHLLDHCRSRASLALIAERDRRPCGFLILLTDAVDEVTQLPQGFVAYMAVAPDVRRAGAARALLRVAEEEARRLGLPHLSLMVTVDNAAARRLYASSGFLEERAQLTKPVGASPTATAT